MKTYVTRTTPDATLGEAVDLMDLYQVSGLPVVDAEGRLLGMLMERDVIRALLPEGSLPAGAGGRVAVAERLQQRKSLRVGDFMTRDPLFVPETADVAEAARLMLAKQIKRLPVVGEDGKVVGVLSRIDICQALLEGDL